jgi:hypothetical protein
MILAKERKYLGTDIGMMGVLHTWTRDLRYHPHIHFLIPAGGSTFAALRSSATLIRYTSFLCNAMSYKFLTGFLALE